MNSYFDIAVNLGIIFGPLIGYVAQLLVMKKKKSSEGFSIQGSVILVIANILRVFFW